MYVKTEYSLVNAVGGAELAKRGRRVHFLHVPKTAGTTTRYVLEGYAAIKGLTCANEARRAEGEQINLTEDTIVMGHRRCPDILARDDTCYISVFRDPVERIESLIRMRTSRFGKSVGEVIDVFTWGEINSVTQLFTGAECAQDADVEAAKQRLSSGLHLFGFQDRFDEFMAMLAGLLEIDGIVFPRFQVATNRVDFTKAQRAYIFTESRADRALYDFAKTLYASRVTPRFQFENLNEKRTGKHYLLIEINIDANEAGVKLLAFSGERPD